MTLQACADLVRRGDPDRFLAVMAAPPAARRVLFAIYAFNLEIARAPWITEESMIAEMRLQWWRDALEEIAQGRPVRTHEVTTVLADILDPEGAQLLDRLVQARRWDIYRDPFEDDSHFEDYLDQTAGNLTWAAARALGVKTGQADVRDIAWAAGLANWFIAIPALEARGRIPLLDGRAAAVRDLACKGLGKLDRARPPRAARSALLASWRARGILKRARAMPERVALGTLAGSEFMRRMGLAWARIKP